MSVVPASLASEPTETQRSALGQWLHSIADHRYACGLIVWGVAAVYLVPFVNRGWMPHDEGLLAHTAERVLNGELPHLDFDDAYTGGLALLHSAAMRVMGVTTSATRWTLYFATLLWIPLLYLIALRSTRPPVAALTAALCVVWSVPNYFAGMPSWYILFLATACVYLLIRFCESGSRLWLVLAGAASGVALLAKINGLFIIAAALLFLLFHRQRASARADRTTTTSASLVMFTSLVATAFAAVVGFLIWGQLAPDTIAHFLIPALAIGLVLTCSEINGRGASFRDRLSLLVFDVSTFLLGAAIPMGLFLIPYIATDSLSNLLHGVFVLPQRRLGNAALPFPPLVAFLFAVPVAIYLVRWRHSPEAPSPRVTTALIVSLSTLLLVSTTFFWHHAIWLSLRMLSPLLITVGACWLIHSFRSSDSGNQEEGVQKESLVFLLLAMSMLLSLLQFPFAANIYFCYFAPLLILAAVGLRATIGVRSGTRGVVVLAFFLLFAVVSLNRGFLAFHCDLVAESRRPLSLERTELQVSADHREAYERIVELVRQHSKPSDAIYAAPDCPEVYFLTDRRNPTRTMYDFFDDPVGRTETLVRMLNENDIRVVVVNTRPLFSESIDTELLQFVRQHFPTRYVAGGFVVAIRDSAADEFPGESNGQSPRHVADAGTGKSRPRIEHSGGL